MVNGMADQWRAFFSKHNVVDAFAEFEEQLEIPMPDNKKKVNK